MNDTEPAALNSHQVNDRDFTKNRLQYNLSWNYLCWRCQVSKFASFVAHVTVFYVLIHLRIIKANSHMPCRPHVGRVAQSV